MKNRDLGPHVEADSQEVPQAAIDIQAAVVGEGEFAGCVAAVRDGQQGRRQERRFALAAVRVAGEDPAATCREGGTVDRVGVVAEGERGAAPVDLGNDRVGFEARAPEVVEADDLQTFDHAALVAKDVDVELRESPCRGRQPRPFATNPACSRDCRRWRHSRAGQAADAPERGSTVSMCSGLSHVMKSPVMTVSDGSSDETRLTASIK